MMDTAKALESIIRLGRLLMDKSIAADQMTPTEIIACDGLVKDWEPGDFAVGDVRNHEGQTYRCCQAHSSLDNEGWTPPAAPALWAVYHSSDPAFARPWVAPTGAQDTYMTGECMVWTDGSVRRSKQDNVVYGPDVLPDAWETVKAVAVAAEALETWTVAELRAYAQEQGISLSGATLKADIIAAIVAATA